MEIYSVVVVSQFFPFCFFDSTNQCAKIESEYIFIQRCMHAYMPVMPVGLCFDEYSFNFLSHFFSSVFSGCSFGLKHL